MAELDECPPSALPSSSLPTSLCSSPVTFQSNDEMIIDEFYLENLSNESLNEAMPRPLKRPRSDEDADTVTWSSTSTSGFSLLFTLDDIHLQSGCIFCPRRCWNKRSTFYETPCESERPLLFVY